MRKKALRIIVTLGLLVAGYAAYGRAFPLLTRLIVQKREDYIIPYDPSPSRSARMATELAIRAFGKDHWSVSSDCMRYYNADRGYWMYAQKYDRMADGKRALFSPFAVIIQSKDKKGMKTLRGNSATLDFDKPFDMSKPEGEPAHIMHGQVDGDVLITDDQGTPANLADDLLIGPLTYLEYDEKKLQIRSESHVVLKQGDMDVVGDWVTIDLRPNESVNGRPPAGGFSSAKSITLFKNVKINVKDVGRSGIVPGGAKKPKGDPRPGELTCAGMARFDLPKPAPVGYNGPPAPTLAEFHLNVRLRQGSDVQVDQMDADELRLVLVPAEKPAEPTKSASPAKAVDQSKADQTKTADAGSAEESGALSSLTLRRAVATGHAVWLQSQSESQRIKARGTQLIYERFAPANPDKIYFRGDSYTLVEVYKLGNKEENLGKVLSIDTIRTDDVTIFQPLKQGEEATIIARGPGTLETRADRDKPIDRKAKWGDRLEVQTVGVGEQSRRRITLFDHAEVESPTQAKMSARDKIIAFLKPETDKDKPEAEGTPATPATPASPAAASNGGMAKADMSRIDWVEGHGEVHLVTLAPPGSDKPPSDIYAREWLTAIFKDQAAPPAVQTTPAPVAVAAAPGPAGPQEPAQVQDKKVEEKKPADPPIHVEADRVWARIVQIPGEDEAKGKSEIKEARLRRRVLVHQDPAANELVGKDLKGDAIDVINQGEGRLWLQAHGLPGEPAQALSEGRLIEGPILTLDQGADFASVKGAGRLVQEPRPKTQERDVKVDTGNVRASLESDEPVGDRVAGAPARQKDDSKKGAKVDLAQGPMTVRWQDEMRFYGRPPDNEGLPGLAWAWFSGGVRANAPDATMRGKQMEVHFDQPISFSKPERDPQDPTSEPRAKTEIVAVHVVDDADTRLLSRDPMTGELQKRRIFATDPTYSQGRPLGVLIEKFDRDETTGEIVKKQRIEGHDVTYDKPTGEFEGKGPGIVRLYDRKLPNEDAGNEKATASRTTLPVAGPRTPPSNRTAEAGTGVKKQATQLKPLAPEWKLTRVRYTKEMKGQFQSDDETASNGGPNKADFLGAVQAFNAKVKDFNADLNPDAPPAQFTLLTAKDVLHITSEPPPPGSKVARNLLKAEGNPSALTEKKSISGEVIEYDSQSELFTVYGGKNSAYIVDQDSPGQPFTVGRSRDILYNKKTGEMRAIEPKSFVFVDQKSVGRAQVQAPTSADDGKNAKKKPKRPNLRPTPRNDKERRGFNGR